jgi:hypothetical protein
MLGAELQDHFTNDEAHKDNFIGVLGAEEVKSALRNAKKRTFCVVNVEKTTQNGTHWYCVFKHSANCYDVMDSLGTNEQDVRKRLGVMDTCSWNKLRVQPETSNLCGAYCAYFIYCRLLNFDLPFEEIFPECFTADLEENEKNVLRYWTTGEVY